MTETLIPLTNFTHPDWELEEKQELEEFYSYLEELEELE